MLLIIDNYDSFTFNLVDYFEQLGEECVVVKNDTSIADIPDLDFKALVLSPGPGKPDEAGYLLDYVKHFKNKLPILGICLGHQAIAQHFGYEVHKAIKPMHGKISNVFSVSSDRIFDKLPSIWQVVRYHSLVVSCAGEGELIALAETAEGENMMLKHKGLAIYGIQYHPEAALTQHGLLILENWLRLVEREVAIELA